MRGHRGVAAALISTGVEPETAGQGAAARVLLYRALGLGDFLTGVPAYRAARRAHPDAEVVLAAPEALRPLALLTGAVDTFLSTPELATPAWSGEPPELVVNLHGSGPQSHRALLPLTHPQEWWLRAPNRPDSLVETTTLGGVGRLVAYGRPELGVEGPDWRDDEHEVARWCRLVEWAGMPANPDDLGLAVPDVDPVVRGATVIHPGAADQSRRWPADRFASVAKQLSASGYRVVVTGVSDERALAESVADGAGLPASSVLAGSLDLSALAALVASARLVVCGDTGVAHLATAYGTPSVVLFGAMSPALWGPPVDRPQHVVLRHSELADAGTRPGQAHPALLEITVDEVLDAIGRNT